MRRILVVYYSQTGQQKKILDNIVSPLRKSSDIEIDYLELQTIPKFPYPWGNEFFDCFPESVKGIPAELKPISIDLTKDYDLILLGYQPWYLSPSIPISSFLQSEEASILMNNKRVITVIGARNMWTQAQEIVKRRLKLVGANLVGNIILTDRTDNYIAGITVVRWLANGKKGPTRFLPEAGVSSRDIDESIKFGEIILDHLNSNELENMQVKLAEYNAVPVKYHLVNIEMNARKIFNIFANYVLRKGGVGNRKRKNRIKLFKFYLLFVFFILSPFFSLIFMLKRWLFFSHANKEIKYLKSTDLKNTK